MRSFFTLVVMLGVFLLSQSAFSQSLRKSADDDDTKFTNVGNLQLTITNFGTIGTRNRYWPNQPSAEYPKGSRVEHIYQGGLWIGARSANRSLHLVSTGVTDRSGSSGEGYEYTTEPGIGIVQRSSLSDSRYFDENAVSHQDFVADFTDRHTRVPATGDSIFNHLPLGVSVHQESYAWNFPFAEFFVLLNYTIVNTGQDVLDSVYVGFWNNSVVRNTNFVRPGTTGYFDYGGNGYDSLKRMMYTYEFQPTPGGVPADSYVGIALVGATPFPSAVDSIASFYAKTHYNAWRFRSSSGDNAYFSPSDDFHSDQYLSRYTRMTQSLPQNKIDPLRTAAGNYTTLLSAGPFPTMNPGDTLQVVFAIICAKKAGPDLEQFDKPEQRATLYSNLAWAQQTYNGEDLNGNNQLDPGEDLNANGKLDRYQLPQPPRQPKVRVELDNQQVALYWDKTSSEESVDPISKLKDFEGYRVYRSDAGADFLSSESLLLGLSLVGEFDVAGDSVGYNTGFSQIILSSPKIFPGDTNKYWYRFPPAQSNVTHLNGWQYVYGVSAFDRGDALNALPSLESAPATLRVVPGTAATSDQSKEVGVYPNPYYAHAYWDGQSERHRKIYFYNLPAHCTVTIYTIAGDVVADFEHDGAIYQGENIDWFQQFGDQSQRPTFAGGEHAWDLITKFDQALATGLYLFAVHDRDTGTIKKGKFLVIK